MQNLVIRLQSNLSGTNCIFQTIKDREYCYKLKLDVIQFSTI